MKFLGINLQGVTDYGTPLFADAMKQRRSFAKAGTGPWAFDDSIPVDGDGWPLSDFACMVMAEHVLDGKSMAAGVYAFSCVGKIGAMKTISSDATISDMKYDANTNKTTATITLRGGSLSLDVTGTNGGVKNIKIIRPGHTEQDLFYKPLLEAVKPFNVLRLMDALKTNSNEITSWAARPLPPNDQSTKKGICYEYAFELANQTGKDIWVCMPHQANFDYYVKFFELAKKLLKAERRLYVEHSNEVWNTAPDFNQSRWNVAQAEADVAANNPNRLNYDGSTNKYFWHWRRVAGQAALIAKAGKQVFGASAINDKIRVIYAAQIGYGEGASEFYMFKQGLEYVKAVHGSPKDLFFAISGAPYFSAGKDLQEKAGPTLEAYKKDPNVVNSFPDKLTVDQLVTAMAARATGSAGKVSRMSALAKSWGLKNFNYEGGVDLGQKDAWVWVKSEANRDPRMRKVIYDYMKAMIDNSDGHCYFALSGKDGKFGYWGLGQDIRTISSAPKYLGVVDLAKELGNIVEQPPTTPTEPSGDVIKKDDVAKIINEMAATIAGAIATALLKVIDKE